MLQNEDKNKTATLTNEHKNGLNIDNGLLVNDSNLIDHLKSNKVLKENPNLIDAVHLDRDFIEDSIGINNKNQIEILGKYHKTSDIPNLDKDEKATNIMRIKDKDGQNLYIIKTNKNNLIPFVINNTHYMPDAHADYSETYEYEQKNNKIVNKEKVEHSYDIYYSNTKIPEQNFIYIYG